MRFLRFRRREKHEPGEYFVSEEIEPVSDLYAAALIERGGLACPADLRGPKGDSFVRYYWGPEPRAFLEGRTPAHEDFLEIGRLVVSQEDPATDAQDTLDRLIAERILERYREWERDQWGEP